MSGISPTWRPGSCPEREGGKMFCLAGIGGEVSGILETTRAASMVLAIDGCPLNCARRSLEKAGFSDFRHLQLADLGLAKGQSPVSDEAVARVASAATGLLAAG